MPFKNYKRIPFLCFLLVCIAGCSLFLFAKIFVQLLKPHSFDVSPVETTAANIALSDTPPSLVDIPIAMAMDENYLYPTLVSITSVMENKSNNTNYSFYVMHPRELKEENKEKLLSLERKYQKCHITLIDMQNKYQQAHTDSHISTPSYYRLSLSDILPDKEKVIWLDGDTLTFHDLTDLFDVDMSGYYYKGFLDDNPAGTDKFEIDNDHYICAGVMLINLKELRLNNMAKKFNDFIIQNNDRLEQHDQTVINVICYDHIGILPAKYGVFNSIKQYNAQNYLESLRTPEKYTGEELINAIANPSILHCIIKPWDQCAESHSRNLWVQYAKKTDFFNDINHRYSIENKAAL